MYSLNKIYNEQFWAKVSKGNDDPYFEELIPFLQYFDFSLVYDWGCGVGWFLWIVKKVIPNCRVLGIEGSEFAIPYIKEMIGKDYKIFDLRTNIELGKKSTFSVSSEVAEHIEERYSKIYAQNIIKNTDGHIWITAAVPGQSGHWHINCQPNKYWIEIFESCGAIYSEELTRELKRELHRLSSKFNQHWHLRPNTMVFRTK